MPDTSGPEAPDPCPRCENDKFGAMLARLLSTYQLQRRTLDAEGTEHHCNLEEPPIEAPEPEPLPPEPTPPHPDPALAKVGKKQRHFDWMG